MKKQLFREQVLDAKKTSMFGKVVLTQPLSVSLGLGLTLVSMAAVLAFLMLFQYQHKAQVQSQIEPQSLADIAYQGPQARLQSYLVVPGTHVEPGMALATLAAAQQPLESASVLADKLTYLQRTLTYSQQRQQLLSEYLAGSTATVSAEQQLQTQLQLNEVQQQVNQLTYEISTLSAKLDTQQDWQVDGDTLKAKRKGVLQQWYVQEGQNMTAGAPLYRLGEAEGNLQAWFSLPSGWYADLKAGQSLQVRFDAYPYQKFGVLDLQVQAVDNRQERGGYAALVTLPRHWTDKAGQQQPLFEGMQITAVVQGPSQSLFSWLFRI